jgi:tetratricopeptide (TPR) repeat protein
MVRQRCFLALAVLVLFSLFVTSEVASAQSANAVAAQQACVNAAKQNDNAAAVAACTKALALAPTNALAARIICDGQSGLGNYDSAVTSCSQAIAIDATSERPYINRCVAYMMLGNFANATSDCNQAMALDPKDEDVYINLGTIDLKQQNFTAAITEFNKAIVLAPNSAAALTNRGAANLELGNKDAALADFQSALKIDPTQSTALKGMQILGQPVATTPTPPAAAAAVSKPTAPATPRAISICNEVSATIHVAFAVESQGHFTAAGWWNVDPNKCEPANFNFEGTTLYYAANSDTDHWGGETSLYIADQIFNFTGAEKNRSGAHAEKFNALVLSPGDLALKQLTLTFHFGANYMTDVNIKGITP